MPGCQDRSGSASWGVDLDYQVVQIHASGVDLHSRGPRSTLSFFPRVNIHYLKNGSGLPEIKIHTFPSPNGVHLDPRGSRCVLFHTSTGWILIPRDQDHWPRWDLDPWATRSTFQVVDLASRGRRSTPQGWMLAPIGQNPHAKEETCPPGY